MCSYENCIFENYESNERCIFHCSKNNWFTPSRGIWIKRKVKQFWKELRDNKKQIKNDYSGFIFPQFEKYISEFTLYGDKYTLRDQSSISNTNFGLSNRIYCRGSYNYYPVLNHATYFTNAIFFDIADFSKITFQDNIVSFKKVTFNKELKLSTKNITNLNFNEAHFKQKASFEDFSIINAIFKNTLFDDDISFIRSHFNSLIFSEGSFKGNANFNEITVSEKTNFAGACFDQDALFKNCTFEDAVDFSSKVIVKGNSSYKDTVMKGVANFEDAQFFDEVSFENTSFEKSASFKKSNFKGNTVFNKCKFKEEKKSQIKLEMSDNGQLEVNDNSQGIYDFSNTIFNENLDFSGINIHGSTDFSNARFLKNANFSKGIFKDKTNFNHSQFQNDAIFSQREFESSTDFSNIRVNGRALFEGITISAHVDFSNANFESNFTLSNAKIGEDAIFISTTYEKEADFEKTEFMGLVNFYSSKFYDSTSFQSCVFNGHAQFPNISIAGHANYSYCIFDEGVNFSESCFERNISFSYANFKETIIFNEINCKDIDFSLAKFQKSNDKNSKPLLQFVNSKSNKVDLSYSKLSIETLISDSKFKQLVLSNTVFESSSKVVFRNFLMEDFLLDKYTNESDSVLLDFVTVNNKLDIKNVSFDKERFNHFDISQSDVEIENSAFNSNFFNSVKWGSISDKRYKATRDIFRQLKYHSEQQKNYIDADGFYSLEMKEQIKELSKENKSLQTSAEKISHFFKNKFVFLINEKTSNFSQNWWQPLIWLIIIGMLGVICQQYEKFTPTSIALTINYYVLLFPLVYLLLKEKISHKWFLLTLVIPIGFIYWQLSTDHFDDIAKLLNPANIFKNEATAISKTKEFISLIYKVIVLFLVYQMITSIKKKVRSK